MSISLKNKSFFKKIDELLCFLSLVTLTMDSCPICCDAFTAHLRKPVKCAYCEFSACNVCTKKYLTNGLLDAHCMGCRRAWNDEFLDMNFTKAFRTGAYKKHREDILLDREIAILPTRQIRVEATLKSREIQEKMKKINEQLYEWEKKRQEILKVSSILTRKLTRYTAESEGRPPPAWTLTEGEAKSSERAKFVMKCPFEECRGFLSTAYKCGTCQQWACPDCLVVKGKDKDVEHTCDPGVKETVALIIKESKPCPKCGERISKIDGCDQMWCVDCHTAFSWASGQLVNGIVHNPHYYEFLRQQGNGVAARNVGDVPCGGVPYYHHLQTNITQLDRTTQNTVMAIHRITAEIADFRLGVYQGHFNVNDNGDLGVAYLMKEMTKDQIKVELAKRELKRNKHLAIRAILEMFVNTSTMMLNNIVSHPPGDVNKQKIAALKLEIKSIHQESLDSIKFITSLKEETPGENEDNITELISIENKKCIKLDKQVKEIKITVAELEKNLLTEVKDEFEPTLAAFANLRVYVNESLMGVSRMKNCSVPQINATWGWVPFNKCAVKVKVKKEDSA